MKVEVTNTQHDLFIRNEVAVQVTGSRAEMLAWVEEAFGVPIEAWGGFISEVTFKVDRDSPEPSADRA